MNSFGKLFRIQLLGESHSKTLTLKIDGFKAGYVVDFNELERLLALRRPQKSYETSRIEQDKYIIRSGIIDNHTNGDTIVIEVENNAFDDETQEYLKTYYRNSHADFVARKKYGADFDYRGAGFLSGRLTVLLVIAGYFASLIKDFDVKSEIIKVGSSKNKDEFEDLIKNSNGNSLGGTIKLTTKLEAGLGEPIFDKLTSYLSSILFSVPSVKGVVFADEIESLELSGSKYNDVIINESGTTLTNHTGGVNCGISNGNDLIIHCLIRPISSIKLPQQLFNFKTNKNEEVTITSKNDLFHLNRLKVVLESCVKIALVDLFLINMGIINI